MYRDNLQARVERLRDEDPLDRWGNRAAWDKLLVSCGMSDQCVTLDTWWGDLSRYDFRFSGFPLKPLEIKL